MKPKTILLDRPLTEFVKRKFDKLTQREKMQRNKMRNKRGEIIIDTVNFKT